MRILSQIEKKVPIAADIGISLNKGFREIVFLLLAAIALFYLISLVTFNLEDAGWTHTGSGNSISNAAGSVGAWVADFSLTLIGVVAYSLPLAIAIYGHTIYKSSRPWSLNPFTYLFRLTGLALTLAAGAALADLHLETLPVDLPQSAGGILGQEITRRLLVGFGLSGTSILSAASLLIGVSLFTGASWLSIVDAMGKYTLLVANGFFAVFRGMGDGSSPMPETPKKAKPAKAETPAKASSDAKAGDRKSVV